MPRPSLLLIGISLLTLAPGCTDAGFKSDQQRYRDIAEVDTSGLSAEQAEAEREAAEDRARRQEWIERERRLRRVGGGNKQTSPSP